VFKNHNCIIASVSAAILQWRTRTCK